MAILKPMPHVAKQIQICKNTALTGKSRMKQRHHDTMGILYIEPMSEDGLFPSASFVADTWNHEAVRANILKRKLWIIKIAPISFGAIFHMIYNIREPDLQDLDNIQQFFWNIHIPPSDSHLDIRLYNSVEIRTTGDSQPIFGSQ